MWKEIFARLFGNRAPEFVEPGEREITFTPDREFIDAVNEEN